MKTIVMKCLVIIYKHIAHPVFVGVCLGRGGGMDPRVIWVVLRCFGKGRLKTSVTMLLTCLSERYKNIYIS